MSRETRRWGPQSTRASVVATPCLRAPILARVLLAGVHINAQTDRQNFEHTKTALPSMGHEDQLSLPARPTHPTPAHPAPPYHPYTATLRGDVRPYGSQQARLDLYSAFALAAVRLAQPPPPSHYTKGT